MEDAIRKATEIALTEAGASGVSFAVEWPGDMMHGDYAVNAAMAAAKGLEKNPRELAEILASIIARELGDSAASVEVAGPGFINIRLSSAAIAQSLSGATGAAWGSGTARAAEKIAFEYSCPNPFKEMHIGHLMSTVIGEASSRIIESQGARVLRDTYGGDVGPHVAKAIWALRKKGIAEPSTARELGDAYTHGSRSYEESETAKIEIDALNTQLYQALAKDENERTGEERELLELWRHGRDVSYDSHKSIWKLLGTEFDYILHESDTTPIGMRVVADGLAKDVFAESEGAVIYRGEEKGLHTLVFITSRGTPTYETKEMGLAFMKEEVMGPLDTSYIMTASEQSGHFAVFLSALSELAPELARRTHHMPHGFLRLTTGKMSSREGSVITAKEFLEGLIEKASERNPDPLISTQVAVGAAKYLILRQAPGGDVIFDIEKSLSLDGDSGPYLQYALVRARSILTASTVASESVPTFASEVPTLARLIARFPGVVARAQALEAPHTITQYLTQLASEWNSYYASGKIIGSDDEVSKIALVRAFATTMENGLTLLGIPAPEKM
jgi:arginyl-tRNA synthetase